MKVREIQVSYFVTDREYDSKNVNSSESVFEIFQDLQNADREKFCVVLLTSRNDILAFEVIHVGGVTEALIDPKLVFKAPILTKGCSSLIFVHNHPGGNPDPSDEDKRITKVLKEAGTLLGFSVLDHIIVGDDNYFSFADNGLM